MAEAIVIGLRFNCLVTLRVTGLNMAQICVQAREGQRMTVDTAMKGQS